MAAVKKMAMSAWMEAETDKGYRLFSFGFHKWNGQWKVSKGSKCTT
jgi:hypothetical protein